MSFSKKSEDVEPPSEMFKQLEFIYETYSRSGSLDQFKSQFPDSILIKIFDRLVEHVAFDVDDILTILYEMDLLGIDLVKRKESEA